MANRSSSQGEAVNSGVDQISKVPDTTNHSNIIISRTWELARQRNEY